MITVYQISALLVEKSMIMPNVITTILKRKSMDKKNIKYCYL